MLRAGKGLHTFIRQQHIGSSPCDLAVIEDAAYGAPSRVVVAKLKELAGVYKFILEAHGLEWMEVSPTAVKRCVTGDGRAEKQTVARRLQKRFSLRFQADPGYDLSDAAAVAITGWTKWLENKSPKSKRAKDEE